MVLNTPLNHKRSPYYYNTDVCKDPNDYRSSRPEVFRKKGVLRNSAKFTGNHLYQCLFFNKVAGLQACNFILKMTLVQVFSCEFCEISKNTFFHRIPLVAASVISSKWTA